ncbi:MAG: hypothetical protein ACXVA2_15875 [Mucilaginibacter sp.]
MNAEFLVLAAFFIVITGCVSTGYHTPAATIIENSKSSNDKSIGLVEGALPIAHMGLFDDNVVGKISAEMESNKERKIALRNVKSLLCDGRTPRYRPMFTVTVVVPKSGLRIPIDDAAKSKEKFLSLARLYLQKHFLNDFSEPILYNNNLVDFNPDLERYKQCYVSSKEYRKCGDFNASILTVPTSKKEALKEAYQKINYTPRFYSLQSADNLTNFGEQFLAFIFQNHSAILTPKISEAVFIDYFSNGNVGLSHQQITAEHQLPYDRLQEFSRHAQYVPADVGYKLEDGTQAYPLMLATLLDLAWLKRNFTFVMPKEVIEKVLVEKDIYGRIPSIDWQNYGYDDEGADRIKFSPSLALKNQDYLWSQILKAQNKVSESVNIDGSVNVLLEVSTDYFCAYGTPVTELQGQ